VTLALVGTVLLAILVFAFVLEPLLRARPDEIIVDAVALPVRVDDATEPEVSDDERIEASHDDTGERSIPGRVVDRAVGGDAT